MKEPKKILDKHIAEFIDKSRNLMYSDDELYLILYVLCLQNTGILTQLVLEKTGSEKQNILFSIEKDELPLFVEKPVLDLFEVPKDKMYFHQINSTFNSILDRSKRPKELLEEIEFFCADNSIIDVIDSDGLPAVFDYILHAIIQKIGKKAGDFVLPTEIAGFLKELSGLKGDAKVFNPFAGFATFGISSGRNQNYLAHEINPIVWAVAMLRLDAYDLVNQSELLLCDSFKSWPRNQKFDLVIANPPFRLRIGNTNAKFSGYKWVESFFISEGVKLLKPEGKLITLVPMNFLLGHAEKNVRKQLVDKDLLEAVITFPGGLLMQTNIPFAVLLLNKNKSRSEQVGFFHGSEFVTPINRFEKVFYPEGLLSEINELLYDAENPEQPNLGYLPEGTLKPELIAIDEIKNNSYALDVRRYWLERERGTRLSELLEEKPTLSYRAALNYSKEIDGVNYNALYPFKEIPYIEVPQISTKDLKFSPKDFIIKADILIEKQVRTGKFLKDEAYLVSLIGTKLKPSLVKPSGSLIHLSNDIVAFEVNEKLVNPKWLVRELNSTKVKDQLEVLVNGVIPRIRKKDFFNLKINLPSLKEQNKQLDEIQGLENRVDSLESDIIEQNAYLRHTVAGPLSDLEHSIHGIENILNQFKSNELPAILEQKISKKHLYTLGDYLNDSKKQLEVVLEAVANRLSTAQRIEQKQLDRINLLDFLRTYAQRKNVTLSKKNGTILFDYDDSFFDDPTNNQFQFILGNVELLTTLLDNMIENAVKHAFKEHEKNKIEVYVWGYHEQTDNKRIFFNLANTGVPIPEKITFEDLKRKGFNHGNNSGNGFGLWYVNAIVNKHRGDWFLPSETWTEDEKEEYEMNVLGQTFTIPSSDYVTQFTFSFPILEE